MGEPAREPQDPRLQDHHNILPWPILQRRPLASKAFPPHLGIMPGVSLQLCQQRKESHWVPRADGGRSGRLHFALSIATHFCPLEQAPLGSASFRKILNSLNLTAHTTWHYYISAPQSLWCLTSPVGSLHLTLSSLLLLYWVSGYLPPPPYTKYQDHAQSSLCSRVTPNT